MESKCKKNKHCSLETVKEYPDAFKEICIFCSKTMIWKKDKYGRIDNRKYVRAHLRDFCQPTGITRRTFLELYGTPKRPPSKKKINWDMAAEEAKDMIKELRKERVSI